MLAQCHIAGMKPKDQNVAALERTLKHLKPGQSLSQIASSNLRHVFGAETEDAAIDAARELAKRHHCEFRYNREHGIGHFQRKK